MSRFVVVSFAFLGWGFYEMSGGRDFTPPERPMETASASSPSPSTEPQFDASAATAKFHRAAEQRAASLAAGQETNRSGQARPTADPERRQAVALAQIASAGSSFQDSSFAFSTTGNTSGLRLTSLHGGITAITTDEIVAPQQQTVGLSDESAAPSSPDPETYLDIRQIRASRVNMRQGPGTIYPVLSRLLAGDKVIVIEDSGTGWLQLRTQQGNKIGWVAASLVSQKGS